MRRIITAAVIFLSTGGLQAQAQDLALIIANPDYRQVADVPGARQVLALENRFLDAGFQTEVITGTSRNASDAQANALWELLKQSDRLVVVIAGHILGTRDQTWLLHADGRPSTALTLGQEALPVDPFLDLLAERAGGAVLVLADAARPIPKGFGLADRPRMGDVPQGVTLIEGAAGDVLPFVATQLLSPGQSLAAAAKAAPLGVSISGYIGRQTVLAPLAEGDGSSLELNYLEEQAWKRAQSVGTVQAYQDFFALYPTGLHAAEAQQKISDLTLTPTDRARLAEEALGLSRDQLRALQRRLTLLGFDTRGVDGLLGRNSRRAISGWQGSVGALATGYVTATQISQIEAAAQIRAEELRLEAERRRLEQERRDQAYWVQTGAGTNEAGMRAYLERYPDGLYTKTARAALADIERQRRRAAEEAERLAWDQAVMTGTAGSYAAYLNSYPNGLFAAEAKARLQSLQQPEVDPAVVEAARLEEQRMSLNGFTRQLAEKQLKSLGLDPGATDGQFTPQTRRALRQFQRANNLVPTGYLTRNTVVILLASAL